MEKVHLIRYTDENGVNRSVKVKSAVFCVMEQPGGGLKTCVKINERVVRVSLFLTQPKLDQWEALDNFTLEKDGVFENHVTINGVRYKRCPEERGGARCYGAVTSNMSDKCFYCSNKED
jgi:hypothetical protein